MYLPETSVVVLALLAPVRLTVTAVLDVPETAPEMLQTASVEESGGRPAQLEVTRASDAASHAIRFICLCRPRRRAPA